MFYHFKIKQLCREYAKKSFQESEALYAKYNTGVPHTFSKAFQVKLNAAVYGEPFTDDEIQAYLHAEPCSVEAPAPQKIRIRKLGMRYAAAIITAAVLTTSTLVGLGGVIADRQNSNDVKFSSVKSGHFSKMMASFPYPTEVYSDPGFNGYTALGYPNHVSPFTIGTVPDGFEREYEITYTTDHKMKWDCNKSDCNWEQIDFVDSLYIDEEKGWLSFSVHIAHTFKLYFNGWPEPGEGIYKVFPYRGNDAFVTTVQKGKKIFSTMTWSDGLNDYAVSYDYYGKEEMSCEDIQNFVISMADLVQLE